MDLDHQDHLAEVKTAINELGKPSNHMLSYTSIEWLWNKPPRESGVKSPSI